LPALATWASTLLFLGLGLDQNAFTLQSVPLLCHLDAPLHWLLLRLSQGWGAFVLFLPTILALALVETRRGSLGRRVSFFGDISYSSYMFHFPLQLLVVVVATRAAWSPSVYYAPWFMLAFFAVLILLALASYYYLEMPVQRFLRKGFRRRPASPHGSGPE
jgi:peptidoglycan/LPS O-acetylase OafA/YrhL